MRWFEYSTCYLELEDLLLAVAKLLQGTSKLALVLGADFAARDGLVQARWATDEELNVLLLGLGQNSLQQLLGDESLTTGPILGGLVEDVEGAETAGVGVLQLLELLLQQDILLFDIAEDQGNLGVVIGVLEDLAGKLVHRGDTSTTGNQSDVVVLVGLPRVLDDRALEGQGLVDVQGVDVLGHGSIGIDLDDEIKVAGLV